MTGKQFRTAAAVLGIAAVLVTAQPVFAEESTPDAPGTGVTRESQKEKFLEAMDYLDSLGISPMKIVDRIFGTKVSTGAASAAEALENSGVSESAPEESTVSESTDSAATGTGSLFEPIPKAGDTANSAVQNVKDKAQDAAKDTADKAVDSAATSLKDRIHDWIDGLFN
jgi:hypothetical protein